MALSKRGKSTGNRRKGTLHHQEVGKKDNSSPHRTEPESPQIPADGPSTDAGSTKKRSKPKSKTNDRSPWEGMELGSHSSPPSNPADLASAGSPESTLSDALSPSQEPNGPGSASQGIGQITTQTQKQPQRHLKWANKKPKQITLVSLQLKKLPKTPRQQTKTKEKPSPTPNKSGFKTKSRNPLVGQGIPSTTLQPKMLGLGQQYWLRTRQPF